MTLNPKKERIGEILIDRVLPIPLCLYLLGSGQIP